MPNQCECRNVIAALPSLNDSLYDDVSTALHMGAHVPTRPIVGPRFKHPALDNLSLTNTFQCIQQQHPRIPPVSHQQGR